MDPRPKHVDPANGDHARVRGSSLPYLIPLSGAIASATPPGRCGREAEETWVPSRFSLTAPSPRGLGVGSSAPRSRFKSRRGIGVVSVVAGFPTRSVGVMAPPVGEGRVRYGSICLGVSSPYIVSLRFFSKFFASLLRNSPHFPNRPVYVRAACCARMIAEANVGCRMGRPVSSS